MILHIIQCDVCRRYLASDVDKLSPGWSRRRYFEADDIEYADVYSDIPQVVNALLAGKYTHTDHEGVRCPGCQDDR